jgi:hypothetical protein
MNPILVGAIIIVVLMIMIYGLLSYSSSLATTASDASKAAAAQRAAEDARTDSVKMASMRAENERKAAIAAEKAAEKALAKHKERCIVRKDGWHLLVTDMDQLPDFEAADRINPFPRWTASADSCENKCREHAECRAWSWTEGSGSTCYLANKISGEQVRNKPSVGGRCPID